MRNANLQSLQHWMNCNAIIHRGRSTLCYNFLGKVLDRHTFELLQSVFIELMQYLTEVFNGEFVGNYQPQFILELGSIQVLQPFYRVARVMESMKQVAASRQNSWLKWMEGIVKDGGACDNGKLFCGSFQQGYIYHCQTETLGRPSLKTFSTRLVDTNLLQAWY